MTQTVQLEALVAAIEDYNTAKKTLRDRDADLHAAVKAARSDGASWNAIGGLLGVTRQAAHERFSVK